MKSIAVRSCRASLRRHRIGSVVLGCWLLSLLAACGGERAADSQPAATQASDISATTPPPTATSAPENALPLAVEALSMTGSSPDQGWITYTVRLAVRNTSDGPVVLATSGAGLSASTRPGTPTVGFLTGAASVNTDQNHSYDAVVKTGGGDLLLIPAGAAVSSPTTTLDASLAKYGDIWRFTRLLATFRVPELLHPTQLKIYPGIVYKGVTTSVTLDLASVPPMWTKLINPQMDRAPLAPLQSGPLEISMAPAPSSIVSYHPMRFDGKVRYSEDLSHYQANVAGQFVEVIDVTIKNTDITGDQIVSVSTAILDGFGSIFQGTTKPKIPAGTCSDLPSAIGPGQTVTSRLCFSMPEDHASGNIPLGLLVTTREAVNVFALDAGPASLTNCAPGVFDHHSLRWGGDEAPIIDKSTISIPGSADGSIQEKGFFATLTYDRFGIETPGRQSVSIRLAPGKPTAGTSDTYWVVILQDPSGRVIFMSEPEDPEAAAHIQNVPLVCGGVYALFISADGLGLHQDSSYQITVASEFVSEATPEPSPESR